MQPYGVSERSKLEIDLEKLDRLIAENDLEYKGLGIRYHCCAYQERVPLDDISMAFTVVPAEPGKYMYPYVLQNIEVIDTLVKQAKDHLSDFEDGDLGAARSLVSRASNRIIAMNEDLEKHAETLEACEEAVLEEGDEMDPETKGVDRYDAMEELQQDSFRLWARALKEVKAALKLKVITDDEVHEFGLDEEVDRFIVEEPYVFEKVQKTVDEEQTESFRHSSGEAANQLL